MPNEYKKKKNRQKLRNKLFSIIRLRCTKIVHLSFISLVLNKITKLKSLKKEEILKQKRKYKKAYVFLFFVFLI